MHGPLMGIIAQACICRQNVLYGGNKDLVEASPHQCTAPHVIPTVIMPDVQQSQHKLWESWRLKSHAHASGEAHTYLVNSK